MTQNLFLSITLAFLFSSLQASTVNLCNDTDPFVGTFKMTINGQVAGNVTITHLGSNQYKIDSGNGHDIAIKNGQVLEGTSEGIPFRILVNGINLTMELLGSAFDLVRVSEQLANQESNSMAKSQNDSFVGMFDLVGDNTILGRINIANTGGNNYQLTSANSSGFDLATKNGNQLSGVTSGAPFTITINGNNLSFNISGVSMQLVRVNPAQVSQSGSTPGTIDQRLLGVWRYTHIQRSGSDQLVTDYKIGFKQDGTYNTKSQWAGMGSSGEDPQQFGQYQIISMNQNGGIVRLDGRDLEYYFSGGSVKIGSTIYEFIRK